MRKKLVSSAIACMLAATPLASNAAPPLPVSDVPVIAYAETEPVASQGDAADDPAIWVNPVAPDKSIVFGTDKDGGLYLYDMNGQKISFRPDGELNNVDLRTGFDLDDDDEVIVAATNRSDNTIAVYVLDRNMPQLIPAAARPIKSNLDVYGFSLYRNRDDFFAFVTDKEGAIEQWRLFDNGEGKVDGEIVRELRVGGQSEGVVSDDALGFVYIAEEGKGIWKFDADPDGSGEGVLIDEVQPKGRLTADVEGLALYLLPGGDGFLIASSQGSSQFLVYGRKGDNPYRGAFRVVDSDATDGVSETDGIDVTSANLGGRFERGMFVCQDDENDDGAQNFKYVAWSWIADALSLDHE